jgi:septal ring factor EnvC (AmiA/AmiB activator)
MKCGLNPNLSKYFSFWKSSSVWFPALLITVLLTVGPMPVWSQDSNPKSNGYSGISQTFELSLERLNRLHDQASSQLTGLTRSLNQASQELQTSKTQLTRLQNLLNNALLKSTDLENTNQKILESNRQIGERMQERDEALARAYDELNVKDKKILKMRIAIAILGLGCLGFIAFGVIKLLVKLHIL